MSFERKKTKKNRECYVLDLFDKVKKKTCLCRYWYTSEVFANTINKSFGLNDPIEVKELDRGKGTKCTQSFSTVVCVVYHVFKDLLL